MSWSVCLGEDKGKYIQITLSVGHQGTSLVAHLVKNLPASAGDAGDMGSIPGWEDPLEKEMAAHSSILFWEFP